MKRFYCQAMFAVVVVTMLLVASPLAAQTAQGRITGTVSDSSGAVIPGVEVVAINEETGLQTQDQANEVGLFVLPFLAPGRYTLHATSEGFKTYERSGVVVETSQVLQLNITMELGAITETVTVTSQVPLLQTSDATVDQFIDQRAVNDMPLANRRALELVRLSSNVIFVTYAGDAKPQFAVAGGRGYKSTYLLDGGNIQNIRMASAQVDIDPPVEVIKEFRVVQNGYAAEYGGSASGVLISTTKSGTNQFHGSAFEYFRNDALDAPGFFAPTQGDEKIIAPLRYNLFGGTMGGPIIQNKTHFFAGYEGTRKSTGSTQIMTVPDALQRAGDFSQTFTTSGALMQIYDPHSTRTEDGKSVRDPFAGNIIPANLLDPVALKLNKYWPEPNKPATNLAGAQNFSGNRSNAFNRDNVTARVDHAVSNKNRFYFRFVYNKDPYTWSSNYPLDGAGDPQSPISPTRWETSYLARDTHTVTPNLIMDVGYSFSNRTWYAYSAGLGSGAVDDIGLPNVSNESIPMIRGTGVVNLGSGQERKQFPIRQHQVTNSWTWVKGNHVMKFGGEVRKGINVDINRPIISGQYNYSITGTQQAGVKNTGNAYASYMLGWVNAYSTRETMELDRYSYYLAWYVQDDWKVRSDLTLNIGLRWETDTAVMDKNNRNNSFDRYQINPVSGTPGVVKFSGLNGWDEAPYRNDWNNLGPRFGFAWKPGGSDRWVVRGGYGIFYEMPSTSANAATLGFELSAATSSPDNGITPAFLFRNGPNVSAIPGELNDSFGAVPVGKKVTTNVSFYEQNRRAGYAHHINFGIQRMLPKDIMLEVNYTGNLSRKLPIGNLNINQVRIEEAGPGNAQVKRPFPQFGNVTVLSPTMGSNNYHSGNLKLEKRLSSGIAFMSGYTWSKAIGDANNQTGDIGDNQNYQDLYNRRLDRGLDALDIRHRFTWSSTYDLPFGAGRKWLQNHWSRYAVGGWNLGAIIQLQTGGPFTVVTNNNTTNTFSAGGLRANVVGDPNLPTSERTVQRWFNTDAFVAPDAYAFGNAGRGIVRGDGRVVMDLSLSKNFPFGESRRVQVRADFFNAPNHPDFSLPNRTLGAANYGTIGGATQGRTIQLGARVEF